MNWLIDVNVVIDICTQRKPHAEPSAIAALAAEGPVFDTQDPDDAQLIRALERFPLGHIKLLTRDERLLTEHPDQTISPDAYCKLGQPDQRIDLPGPQTPRGPPPGHPARPGQSPGPESGQRQFLHPRRYRSGLAQGDYRITVSLLSYRRSG